MKKSNLLSTSAIFLGAHVEYYLFLLQLKAVFLNLIHFADEHFRGNRLLIKYLFFKYSDIVNMPNLVGVRVSNPFIELFALHDKVAIPRRHDAAPGRSKMNNHVQSVTESIFTDFPNRHAYLVAIALAVLMLSPVTIRTVMPALWHCLIEAGTSGRTGSWNNIHETT